MEKQGNLNLYWGDVHNHNEIGYGKGSLDRSYGIAHGVGLDFYAFTPHGWWPDLPSRDPAVVAYHEEGFDRVRRAWESVVARANEENRDGQFAAFVAYEWHSAAAGDYHLLFPGGSGEIFRADTVGELQAFAREHGALMIPHHIGYRRGWRGTDWDSWSADVSPVIDIFSEHGSTFAADTHLAMRTHSMGGVDRSQTALQQLRRGAVAGFVGSTDNHWGCPASYGEGLAGVWAESLSREGIFSALRRRRTFAVSGDRIGLWFESSDGAMGDSLPAGAAKGLAASVAAAGPIDYVELLKNGERSQLWSPPAVDFEQSREFLVRIEMGWDGLDSTKTTHWLLNIRIEDGELITATPNFCLGAGTDDKVHRLFEQTATSLKAECWTSRRHPHPVNSIVLQVRGSPRTGVAVEAETQYGEEPSGASLAASLAEIREATPWAAITAAFSAPKLCLSGCHAIGETRQAIQWDDETDSTPAFYMVKVQQRNGQCAWSAPIYKVE